MPPDRPGPRHVVEAAANDVDVLWYTEHAERLYGYMYRDTVHFTSLTQEQGAPGQGGVWHWTPMESGSLSHSSGGGIVNWPITPNDPDPHGSLWLAARALLGRASYGFYADSQPSGWNYRDNLNGQQISIDVLLAPGWSRGYLEVLITSSRHEASGGRPAGVYSLSYQIVPGGGQQRRRTADGLTGVITIPVPADGQTWTTLTLDPSHDIAALWPDLDYRDFALFEFNLNAVSTGDAVTGYFGYLRFYRYLNGGELLTQQQEMMAVLAPRHPTVAQQQGLEISGYTTHLNWYGNPSVPDYSVVTRENYEAWIADTVIPQIHAAGGLVSYNHP